MTRDGISGRLWWGAGAALLVAVVAVAPASAQPSLDQYVERLPTAEGDRPSGRPGKEREQLPPAVRRRIEAKGGSSAGDLEAMAESPELGAPRSKREPRGQGAGRTPAVAATAASTAQDAGAPIAWLVLGMAVTGILALVLSFTGRRSKRPR